MIVLIAALSLASCAGSQTKLRMQEGSGELAVMPETGKPYDYTVKIVNRRDIGYDPDNIDTRKSTALALLRTQCPRAEIIGETVVNNGTYAIGTPARTYFVQAKCNAR
jgi:hypothetical protein